MPTAPQRDDGANSEDFARWRLFELTRGSRPLAARGHGESAGRDVGRESCSPDALSVLPLGRRLRTCNTMSDGVH
jgi:hypothetical protein